MGECNCSNIAIMQLFHELKQQFPALPDHVVSQCIAQNSHDKETCARSLRATQDSRPSPGAFPPPAPLPAQSPPSLCAMTARSSNPRPHRPASLDIGIAHRCPVDCPSRETPSVTRHRHSAAPSSAPAACSARNFFDDLSNTPNNTAGFELNVNVACSPAGNRDFRTVPPIGACKRSDLVVEPRPYYAENQGLAGVIGGNTAGILQTNGHLLEQPRSYTSVSLTLRPPSSEPQAPIDIRSQGSSLTYSTSSVDPSGFQSRLQISIGPGNVGSVAAARIRPPMAPTRPTSLLSPVQTNPLRPPGLPAGPPSQLPRPTTTVSAPTTPSVPATSLVAPTGSLPATPSAPSTPPAPSFEVIPPISAEQSPSPLNKVAEHQRRLVAEQLIRKDRLARELRAEKGRLDAMKKELQALARPFDTSVPPQELKRKLRSEIYQLQVECDRMTDEVDQRLDPRVPLGETNEEFYQDIYTGQPFHPAPPPPLPSHPPAWRPMQNDDDSRDEREGPSWVCRMCTFDNHPLMNKCEQCDMPRVLTHDTGGTQDIHIRVTHHHNFSPRRTVHSWVV